MPETTKVLLTSWLTLLCKMIPGITQAVVLTSTDKAPGSIVRWPQTSAVNNDLMATAYQAARQKQTISTTFSSSEDDEQVSDAVLAMPLNKIENLNLTLAMLVKIKPSQKTIILQILQWGEDWLILLLQTVTNSPELASTAEPTLFGSWRVRLGKLTMLRSNNSRLVLAAVVIILLVSLMNGTYRVTSPARLEGKIQRVIVAPFDGYIANAISRAGETVHEGEVIAEMDDQSLRLEQQQHVAKKNEYTRQYRQALANREKAQAHIYKSQIKQADAQLQLLEKKIQRSRLVAPLEGIIISGDLSRSLGAPVKMGDVLFEVSPLDQYRLIVLVDEKQVVDIKQGLQGTLTLTALPAVKINFTVRKVSPVFEENNDGVAYRVEATISNDYPVLRPGMQGVAKIDIDQRRIAWIYLHELYDAIRLWAWSWLP